ncbi:MAG: hypothetical protein LAP40_16855 [Acidobacteriia bacterium]|nr:hypothetical protein [Terriglobia bacterium]
MPALAELLPGWIGRSRIVAAKLAECEKCAQVAEQYVKELDQAWTELDDHAPADPEKRASIAAARAIATRIRLRNAART